MGERPNARKESDRIALAPEALQIKSPHFGGKKKERKEKRKKKFGSTATAATLPMLGCIPPFVCIHRQFVEASVVRGEKYHWDFFGQVS